MLILSFAWLGILIALLNYRALNAFAVIPIGLSTLLATAPTMAYVFQDWLQVNSDVIARPFITTPNTETGCQLWAAASLSTLISGLYCAGRWKGSANSTLSLPIPTANSINVALLSSSLLLLIHTLARGIGSILYRQTYLDPGAYPSLKTLTGPFVPVGIALGVVGLIFGSRIKRLLSGSVLLLYFFVLAGAGSRLAFAVPIIATLAMALSGYSPRRLASFAASILFGCALMPPLIALRLSTSFGLIPYFRIVINQYTESWIAGSASGLGSLVSGVPFSGAVYRFERSNAAGHLGVAINPLPGGMTNWASVAPNLRLHPFIPYPGIGELAANSILWLIAYFALVGLLVTKMGSSLQRWGFTRIPSLIGPLALGALFIANVGQYNLRSATRYAYLIAIALAATSLIRRDEMGPTEPHQATSQSVAG